MPSLPPPPPAIHAPIPVSNMGQNATSLSATKQQTYAIKKRPTLQIEFKGRKESRFLNQRQKRRDKRRFGYNRR